MIVTALRLIITVLLIWRVALGDHWALVMSLILIFLAHEAQVILLNKILKNDEDRIRPRL